MVSPPIAKDIIKQLITQWLAKWPSHIRELLAKDKKNNMLDAVVDSAGGDIMNKVGKFLKQGGRVVCYGM